MQRRRAEGCATTFHARAARPGELPPAIDCEASFYRRFDAPGSNPLLNAAVYAGIGAKLGVSLAITAVRGR